MAVLRGATVASHRWPRDGQWVAIATWRHQSIAAVLVGRRDASGKIFYDVVNCQQHLIQWFPLGGGGSPVSLSVDPYAGSDNAYFFYSQSAVFDQDNGEEVYIATFVGVAEPGVESLNIQDTGRLGIGRLRRVGVGTERVLTGVEAGSLLHGRSLGEVVDRRRPSDSGVVVVTVDEADVAGERVTVECVALKTR